MDENVDHLDFQPDDPKLQKSLEAMAQSGSPDANEIRQESRRFPSEPPYNGPTDEDSLAKKEKSDRLVADVDRKLKSLYSEAELRRVWSPEAITEFMRAAFGLGYALGRQDTHGDFARQHGYRDPADNGQLHGPD